MMQMSLRRVDISLLEVFENANALYDQWILEALPYLFRETPQQSQKPTLVRKMPEQTYLQNWVSRIADNVKLL